MIIDFLGRIEVRIYVERKKRLMGVANICYEYHDLLYEKGFDILKNLCGIIYIFLILGLVLSLCSYEIIIESCIVFVSSLAISNPSFFRIRLRFATLIYNSPYLITLTPLKNT